MVADEDALIVILIGEPFPVSSGFRTEFLARWGGKSYSSAISCRKRIRAERCHTCGECSFDAAWQIENTKELPGHHYFKFVTNYRWVTTFSTIEAILSICLHLDDAFLDRADIKQYIGAPPPQAIYGILRSCVVELMRVGLVESFVSPYEGIWRPSFSSEVPRTCWRGTLCVRLARHPVIGLLDLHCNVL